MEFTPAATKVPTAITEIKVTVQEDLVRYRFIICYDDHSKESRAGNLVPHLTPQQIDALQTFMTTLRAQAEAQVLPKE
jgi:hypothetical protein